MTRVVPLIATEARLLVRDWTVLVFAFLFPAFVMLVLAGVFGNNPDPGYGMQRPDAYYVAAATGIPMIALALVGLPVTFASYRESGVLRRLEAFGISTGQVIVAQATVTLGLVLVGAAVVLAVAIPAYGIPSVTHPLLTVAGFAMGTLTFILIGIAIGLAVRTARAAQAVGLLSFFPLYLLGGGGPPRGVMTSAMHTIADALPSAVPAITDPWLGVSGQGSQLAVLAVWALAASAVIAWLSRRTTG